MNLLSNAVKFTPRGWVVLRCGHEYKNDHQGRLRPLLTFQVADTGVGLEPRHAEDDRPANQADSSSTRKFGGLSGAVHLPGPGPDDGRRDRMRQRARPGLGFWRPAFLEPARGLAFAGRQNLLRPGRRRCRLHPVEDSPVNQMVAKGVLEKWATGRRGRKRPQGPGSLEIKAL